MLRQAALSAVCWLPLTVPTLPLPLPPSAQIWHGDLPNAKDVEEEEEEEKERVIKLDDDQVTREELIEIVRSCVRDSIANARNGGKFNGLPWLLTERREEPASGNKKELNANGHANGNGKKQAASRARRGASVATEEEIIRAADMLLDQCGEDREDVETEDFSSLTHALERMLQGQQRLVDGQRLVIEGQQRVQSAEKRIEEMHHTVKARARRGGGARRSALLCAALVLGFKNARSCCCARVTTFAHLISVWRTPPHVIPRRSCWASLAHRTPPVPAWPATAKETEASRRSLRTSQTASPAADHPGGPPRT